MLTMTGKIATVPTLYGCLAPEASLANYTYFVSAESSYSINQIY